MILKVILDNSTHKNFEKASQIEQASTGRVQFVVFLKKISYPFQFYFLLFKNWTIFSYRPRLWFTTAAACLCVLSKVVRGFPRAFKFTLCQEYLSFYTLSRLVFA